MLKIVVLGYEKVGKTTMIQRFTENHRIPPPPYFFNYPMRFQGKDVQLQIWDVSVEYQSKKNMLLIQSLFLRAKGGILVYDICNRVSFERIQSLQIERSIPWILVGILKENTRQVSFLEGQQLANKWNVAFFETNISTGENISDAFHFLFSRLPSPAASKTRTQIWKNISCYLF